MRPVPGDCVPGDCGPGASVLAGAVFPDPGFPGALSLVVMVFLLRWFTSSSRTTVQI
jgi:hypothetical protein